MNSKTFEPMFIQIFMGLCVYYFYLQLPNFAIMGEYHGPDPVKVNQARTGISNITADYYANDKQSTYHQKFYHGFSDGSLFQYGHIFGGYVWWAGMLIQLTGALRERSRLGHQITGYMAFFAAQALAISGFYGLINHQHDLTYSAYTEEMVQFTGLTRFLLEAWLQCYLILFWGNGIWLSLTAWVYLYYIVIGKQKLHRQWILRHCMVGFATLMKRICFGFWPLLLMYSPIDLHGIPSSFVKATCANVWILIAHPLASWLINRKFYSKKIVDKKEN